MPHPSTEAAGLARAEPFELALDHRADVSRNVDGHGVGGCTKLPPSTVLDQHAPRDQVVRDVHDEEGIAVAAGVDLSGEASHHGGGLRPHGEAPDEMPEVSVADLGPGAHRLPPLLVRAGLAASNGEGARKMREGAVYVDGARVTDIAQTVTIDRPIVVKLGRRYARLVP